MKELFRKAVASVGIVIALSIVLGMWSFAAISLSGNGTATEPTPKVSR